MVRIFLTWLSFTTILRVVFALEASFMGVKLTPIDKFKKWLKLNKVPYVLVGRLKNRDNIEASVQKCNEVYRKAL